MLQPSATAGVDDEMARKLLEREAVLLSRLRHPNVPRLLGVIGGASPALMIDGVDMRAMLNGCATIISLHCHQY